MSKTSNMKYVRTKDGIYKVILVSPLGFIRIDKRDGTYPDIFEKDIIKQADNIEELCDVFVHGTMVFKTLEECIDYAPFGGKIYGSIWVDGNLIKVAKMNDKGELELL